MASLLINSVPRIDNLAERMRLASIGVSGTAPRPSGGMAPIGTQPTQPAQPISSPAPVSQPSAPAQSIPITPIGTQPASSTPIGSQPSGGTSGGSDLIAVGTSGSTGLNKAITDLEAQIKSSASAAANAWGPDSPTAQYWAQQQQNIQNNPAYQAELQLRQSELAAYQDQINKVKAQNDNVTAMMNRLFSGETLPGMYAGFGKPASIDQLNAMYEQNWNPVAKRLAGQGLGRSSIADKLAGRAKTDVDLYNLQKMSDEQKFMLGLANSMNFKDIPMQSQSLQALDSARGLNQDAFSQSMGLQDQANQNMMAKLQSLQALQNLQSQKEAQGALSATASQNRLAEIAAASARRMDDQRDWSRQLAAKSMDEFRKSPMSLQNEIQNMKYALGIPAAQHDQPGNQLDTELMKTLSNKYGYNIDWIVNEMNAQAEMEKARAAKIAALSGSKK